MTLDEAIEHAEEVATTRCGECAEEHEQLAEWLREMKRLKSKQKRRIFEFEDENAKLRELVRDMWRDGMCDCDEQYTCAECEYGYHERMRDLGIEVE